MAADRIIGRYVNDRYHVESKLGAGGVGDVYAAVELRTGIRVALKVLRKEAVDPAAPERFLREAHLLAKLRNPHIVRIFDFDRDMALGILYVAMELVSGDDLARLLSVGRPRAPLALEIVDQVCSGLEAAHGAGIMHRDIKPGNIRLVPRVDGAFDVKLLDFGFARSKSEKATLTGAGRIPGTISYTSPEEIREGPIDERIDLYALGVVFYQMLAGKKPFDAANIVDVAHMHLTATPPAMPDFVEAEFPPEVIALVFALLEKNPDDRPASARAVREVLAQVRERYRIPSFWVAHTGTSQDPVADWNLLF